MLALAGQRLNRTGIDGDAEPARRGHNRHCVLPRGSSRRAAPVMLGQPGRSARALVSRFTLAAPPIGRRPASRQGTGADRSDCCFRVQ